MLSMRLLFELEVQQTEQTEQTSKTRNAAYRTPIVISVIFQELSPIFILNICHGLILNWAENIQPSLQRFSNKLVLCYDHALSSARKLSITRPLLWKVHVESGST